jgi:hypothetical protein
MSENRIRLQKPDEEFEKLLTRMCRAGWIDSIIEWKDEDAPLHFHFTARGKERFRALDQMMRELGNDPDLMSAAERSELLAIVEAWISDVEEQQD